MEENQENLSWWVEPIYLAPKRPLPYKGQVFCTLRPISQCSDTILWFGAEGIHPTVKGMLGGAICTKYDGIKELFEPEERPKDENGPKEAL
jgi:hypothetical protein